MPGASTVLSCSPPNLLAGADTLTEELTESERWMFSRRGRKLDVICLDLGGAGGSVVCEESLYADGGGEVEGVCKSEPSVKRPNWPEDAATGGCSCP